MRRLPRSLRLLLGVSCLLASPLGAAGSAIDTVHAFFKDLYTLEADFHQQVLTSEGKLQQESDGHVWILRPGRFRWNYLTPYKQQLVADGRRLWSYDEDLAQVSVQPMDKVFSSTPAMLLSGNEPLEKVFRLQEEPAEDGQQQVRLTPISNDSSVIEVHLFFVNGELSRIEASDNFGNTTTFSFSGLVRNAVVDESIFRFVPPPDVDVVGDTG
ncbi:MAG: outer membrane lipoprotein chaperone LolA [Gammaproteobacteria bacterium]